MSDPGPSVPSKLTQLSPWLAAREAAIGDVREAADKQVVWYGGKVGRRPLALLYLHGFSATRQETRPFADLVADALGANLFYTRLSGHGRTGDAMAQASVEDWLNDGREALAIANQLGEEVVVVACSTGATLATALAMEDELDVGPVKAMVFISPNFGVANRGARVFLWPLGGFIARIVGGAYREFSPVNEAHARYWTTRYPTSAVGTMMRLLQRVERGSPAALDMPVLTFYSPKDKVLDVPALLAMQERFANPRNRLQSVEDAADKSQHVLAGDALSAQTSAPLAEQAIQFLLSLDRSRPD
ncbi:MAG: alpha/beta fold hydrolase [Pseudomonadota bacterium]